MSRREIDKRFDNIVSFAEMEEFIDTPVKFYSSGMVVRLGFSVAISAEPDVLIVDEVLSVGDVAFQRKCLGKMSDVATEGRTVLFVSHNMAAVTSLCQRGILLDAGRVVADGPVADTAERYFQLVGMGGRRLFDTTAYHGDRDAIRFHELVVRDAAGREASSVPPTGAYDVELEFEVLRDGLGPFRLGVSASSPDGARLWSTQSSDYDQDLLELPRGVYRGSFTIENNLRPGTYYLNLSANQDHPASAGHGWWVCVDRAFELEVQQLDPDAVHNSGPVRPESSWALHASRTTGVASR
jgi:lipopolysaccharide transport system ATP-binding protein